MQCSRTAQVSNSSGNNSKISVKSLFVVTFGALALTVFLLHSTLVMAGNSMTGNNTESVTHQLAQNGNEYNSKVDIGRDEMTAEKKSKRVSKDNVVGAFSMEDGAREGAYGDGEYAY